MFRTLLALLAALVFSIATFAQQVDDQAHTVNFGSAAIRSNQQTQAPAATPAATSNCTYTFTSGGTASVKYLQYCITVNGNVVEFQSPLGT